LDRDLTGERLTDPTDFRPDLVVEVFLQAQPVLDLLALHPGRIRRGALQPELAVALVNVEHLGEPDVQRGPVVRIAGVATELKVGQVMCPGEMSQARERSRRGEGTAARWGDI